MLRKDSLKEMEFSVQPVPIVNEGKVPLVE